MPGSVWKRAQSKAKDLLGKADPFTERIEKGEKVLFRARFAGLEKDQAEAACKHLKRSEIPCMLREKLNFKKIQ